MSIVVSQNIVLSDPNPYGLTLDHPIIGWDNIVTVDNIVATSEATGYPVTNLANPATHLRWRGSPDSPAAAERITITTGSADDIDYLAIAKHNFGTATIEAYVGYSDDNSPETITTLAGPIIPANDAPLLFRWTPGPLTKVTLFLAAGDAAPEIGALFTGKLTVLPRKIYQGFTPPSHGRMGKEVNLMAESGDYLGTITTQRHVESKIPLSLIDPTYYRDFIDDFIAARPPFFIGWRPQTYPNEVGYMRLTNWPQPAPQSPHSLLSMSLEMTGTV